MFLLVPAYPGCLGQTAVKWLLLLLSELQEGVTLSSVNCDHYCLYLSHNLIVFSRCVDFFILLVSCRLVFYTICLAVCENCCLMLIDITSASVYQTWIDFS